MTASEPVRDVSRDDHPPIASASPTGAPPPGAMARAWALSAAWGWLVLATVASLAIVFGGEALRDALDLVLAR